MGTWNNIVTIIAVITGPIGMVLGVWAAFFKDKPKFSVVAEYLCGTGKPGIKVTIIAKNQAIFIHQIGYEFAECGKKWLGRNSYSVKERLEPGSRTSWTLPIEDIIKQYGEAPIKAIVQDQRGKERSVSIPKCVNNRA